MTAFAWFRIREWRRARNDRALELDAVAKLWHRALIGLQCAGAGVVVPLAVFFVTGAHWLLALAVPPWLLLVTSPLSRHRLEELFSQLT